MQSTLPDFTPRDAHGVWYMTSKDTVQGKEASDDDHGDPNNHNVARDHVRPRSYAMDRRALNRLAMEEQNLHRRMVKIQNFGSGWLRPIGVPKTLHQMREEQREQEEHQEALRRERLAEELAAAEGQAMPLEGMMEDIELQGARDLDDEIPDADAEDLFGTGPGSDRDEDDADGPDGSSALNEEALREERRNELMAARMRMTDDAFREALVRGDGGGDDMYGDGDEDLDHEQQSHILSEEDFAQEEASDEAVTEINLDDDIPEAQSELYEHTDSAAELSSSDVDESRGQEHENEQDHRRTSNNDNDNFDYDYDFVLGVRRIGNIGVPPSPTHRPRRRPRQTQDSMDVSGLLSQDESSFMESSPAQRRRRQT